ncbi:4'-phosphopantetheinyl transferase [Kitasatospora sp. GAS204B]|uniref:4'-phosphopantetheinyl transferase family protein n=1 Tax=unclassified Kitasatospora TaxID=2633591 RepID=UPI0024751861|nr:4'-phosphopantetheinyl transferase superfamily protein [Kitasatospora sp. GAS204B]MDH6122868.1 4'-phosphopantetheinyl transferase EntD [Kitasatospora sp. GAS204B]
MLEGLLPGVVRCAEEYGEVTQLFLFPEEWAVIARAVIARRDEFAAVRSCARQALAEIGIAPQPILPGQGGAPRWPKGVVGSMTHCSGYRAAAVARDSQVAALGIDAECAVPLKPGILDAVASSRERSRIRALAASLPHHPWDTLLFSAKEAVYKSLYPGNLRQLDFLDAEIDLDPDAGTFQARLTVNGLTVGGIAVTRVPGRWAVQRGFVLTAVALQGPGPY